MKTIFSIVSALKLARRAIFNAPARGEYGGGTQTDHWVLERKNHFLKADNLNIK